MLIRNIRRIISFRYRLTCFRCDTKEIIYQSKWANAKDDKHIRKEEDWEESLSIWGDKMRLGIEKFLEQAARQKCKKYGKVSSVCWRYEIEYPGIDFTEEVEIVEKVVEKVVEVPKIIEFTPIEIARVKIMIKNYEEAATRLAFAREDLLKRAKELREKYNIRD